MVGSALAQSLCAANRCDRRMGHQLTLPMLPSDANPASNGTANIAAATSQSATTTLLARAVASSALPSLPCITATTPSQVTIATTAASHATPTTNRAAIAIATDDMLPLCRLHRLTRSQL